MHASTRYRTPSLTCLAKDREVSFEFRSPRSPIWSLTSLNLAQPQSLDENYKSCRVTHPAHVGGRKAFRNNERPRKEEEEQSLLENSRSTRNASLITDSLF